MKRPHQPSSHSVPHPLLAELRGKLADLQREFRDARRAEEAARARTSQLQADIEATQRVISMMDRPGAPTPTPLVQVVTTPPAAHNGTNGATNGLAPSKPFKLDDVIFEVARPDKLMSCVEIRDALLLKNVPVAQSLVGSTYLFNVLSRMTKRGHLVKEGRGYRRGSAPPVQRRPVGYERCAMVLTEAGRPMTFSDMAKAVNERWGTSWEAVNAKWAVKERKSLFEVIHAPSGLWGLREWPEALKAVYRARKVARSKTAQGSLI